jgi:hypothetical protein
MFPFADDTSLLITGFNKLDWLHTTHEGSPCKTLNNITHGRKPNRETRQPPPNELPETTKTNHRHLPMIKVSKSNSRALTVIKRDQKNPNLIRITQQTLQVTITSEIDTALRG